MKIIPVNSNDFGTAYDVGWSGFTRTMDAVGDGIAYGERFERDAALPSVNHALTVTGPGTCVQAHIDDGVQTGLLSDYINDPKTSVYFRKPLLWTPSLGQSIVAAGLAKVGDKYDKLLIAENALADTLAGHVVNEIFGDWPHEYLDEIIEKLTPDQLICSFLVAYELAAQPCYKGFPLFKRRVSSIDPQLLFGAGPYEPFVNQVLKS